MYYILLAMHAAGGYFVHAYILNTLQQQTPHLLCIHSIGMLLALAVYYTTAVVCTGRMPIMPRGEAAVLLGVYNGGSACKHHCTRMQCTQ